MAAVWLESPLAVGLDMGVTVMQDGLLRWGGRAGVGAGRCLRSVKQERAQLRKKLDRANQTR